MAIRALSTEWLFDPDLNEISFEARDLFFRLLTYSDDFGVCPLDPRELRSRVNLPSQTFQDFPKLIGEILEQSLGYGITTSDGHIFFVFKPSSFERYQGWFLGKRSRSRYLQEKFTDNSFRSFLDSSQKFQEIPNSSSLGAYRVESKELKVKSKKQEEGVVLREKEVVIADDPVSKIADSVNLIRGAQEGEENSARRVSRFEHGHYTQLYQAYGLEKMMAAIDAIGARGWHCTLDQLRTELKGETVLRTNGSTNSVATPTASVVDKYKKHGDEYLALCAEWTPFIAKPEPMPHELAIRIRRYFEDSGYNPTRPKDLKEHLNKYPPERPGAPLIAKPL